MKLILNVAKSNLRNLIALVINSVTIITFYYLFFENSEIIYPIVLSIFIIVVYFIIEVIKYLSFKEKLRYSETSPDYKDKNLIPMEEDALAIISSVHSKYLNQLYESKQLIHDREKLFSQWIHNMKTSITVIDLACESNNIEDIKEENNLLRKNLEEALNILRLDDFSRDYITENCSLKELVNSTANSKKRDFIYKGVFPKVKIDDEIKVYTDKKWCAYLIEQVISNSIKYSNDRDSRGIEIFSTKYEDYTVLAIKDYGIGIEKEDLSRVFEAFFTGKNGREERMATGIGLYMVKLISKKLGHEIEIDSEVGKGTIVKIKFRNLSKM